MNPDLAKRISRLASDRESGASELLAQAIGILEDALAAGSDVAAVAHALCRAQPAMASMWNAGLAALEARSAPARFARFAARVARAPQALARFGSDLLLVGRTGGSPLRLVTISYSRSVLDALRHTARRAPLHVACAEGRPALEGRTLASRLAAAGLSVTLFTDAALAHALYEADAVVVGADAVGPEWFLNKSGTRMLAAAAAGQGVPVYVIAGSDKFVGAAIAERLTVPDRPGHEVWRAAPSGVVVRNPYFERTPLDLVSAVVTDRGVLAPADTDKLAAANSECLKLILGA